MHCSALPASLAGLVSLLAQAVAAASSHIGGTFPTQDSTCIAGSGLAAGAVTDYVLCAALGAPPFLFSNATDRLVCNRFALFYTIPARLMLHVTFPCTVHTACCNLVEALVDSLRDLEPRKLQAAMHSSVMKVMMQ